MVSYVRQAGVCGLDTEFYNVDPSKQSCVGRATVHVWSIAIRTTELGPKGFTLCRGWCLPREALDYPPVKALLEDRTIRKEVHNQPVDHHTLKNHGIELRGARNTLSLIKWSRPGLINTNGRFKLKALMWSMLGRNPVCSFKELVTDTRVVQVPKLVKRKLKGCSCGKLKCKTRKTEVSVGPMGNVTIKEHIKAKGHEMVTVYKEKTEEFKYALEDIVPGHKRWDLLVKYAIEDSVAALQIAELADEDQDPAPWPYAVDNGAGPAQMRPKYNQAVELAIILMERAGFRRDKDFCTKQAIVAMEDEQNLLNWLHKWYVINSGTWGPHGRRLLLKKTATGKDSVRSGTDGVWTSGPKKLRLFDELGFPRSPVWAKGKVKAGKAKLDHVAMKWIGKNHPPAKQLIDKLLLLGRIRNGLKYLTKLRDADDIVHPVCGPAGDEDKRSGAVTGRLGIKGEIEAQQLPKPGEKDLYQVRRAIIA